MMLLHRAVMHQYEPLTNLTKCKQITAQTSACKARWISRRRSRRICSLPKPANHPWGHTTHPLDRLRPTHIQGHYLAIQHQLLPLQLDLVGLGAQKIA